MLPQCTSELQICSFMSPELILNKISKTKDKRHIQCLNIIKSTILGLYHCGFGFTAEQPLQAWEAYIHVCLHEHINKISLTTIFVSSIL